MRAAAKLGLLSAGVILVASTVTFAQLSSDDPWPKYCHDARNGDRGPNREPHLEPTLLWRAPVGNFNENDGRGRFWVRERDHTDPEGGYPVVSQEWREYMGNDIYKDLAIDPDGGPGDTAIFVPQRRYVHGYGLAGFIDTGGVGDTNCSGTPPACWRFVHADMLGSTRLITDENGDAVEAMAYTAFGETLGSDVNGVDSLTLRYAWCGAWGYENDDITDASAADDIGLIHVGARYYHASLGRFLQRDPAGLPGGFNLYVYGHSNPAHTVDPSGKSAAGWVGVGLVVALVVAIVADIYTTIVPAGTTTTLGALSSIRYTKTRRLWGQKPTSNLWSKGVTMTFGNLTGKVFRICAKGAGWVGLVWDMMQIRGDNYQPSWEEQWGLDEE